MNNLLENDIETRENIRKWATGSGDDCMNGFLLNDHCFKKNSKLFVRDLSKQQMLDIDADPKAIQQIEIIVNPDPNGDAYKKIKSFIV